MRKASVQEPVAKRLCNRCTMSQMRQPSYGAACGLHAERQRIRLQVQHERKIKLNIEDGEESANWEKPLEWTSQSKSLSKV